MMRLVHSLIIINCVGEARLIPKLKHCLISSEYPRLDIHMYPYSGVFYCTVFLAMLSIFAKNIQK